MEVGTYVKSITATDAGGREQEIPLLGQQIGTVVYVTSASCHWCERNVENVKALAAQRRDDYRFIAITAKPLPSGFDANALGFPLLTRPSEATLRALSLLGPTPTTIVLSPQGRVEKTWVGAYQAGLQREVEAYFNARLPGLSADHSDPQA